MVFRLARRLALLAAIFYGVSAYSQAPEATASWKVSQKAISSDEYELTFNASIEPGWHIYTKDHKYNPTTVEFEDINGYSLAGSPMSLTITANLIPLRLERILLSKVVLPLPR